MVLTEAAMYAEADLQQAHKHSIYHRNEVLTSEWCGCFHCRCVFSPSEITEWVDQDSTGTGTTALCPRCGIDSVIGSIAGFSLSPDFLNEMHDRWFERITTPKR